LSESHAAIKTKPESAAREFKDLKMKPEPIKHCRSPEDKIKFFKKASLPNILFCRKKADNKEAIRQQEPDRQTTAKIQQSQQNLEGGHQWPFYHNIPVVVATTINNSRRLLYKLQLI
jgi:hypothetical protein